MAEARVRLGFRNATDGQIVAMADAVLAGMTNNAAFPKPPADLATLRTGAETKTSRAVARSRSGPATRARAAGQAPPSVR
jgi:3-deoxy-D-arabino-heptulosonate 7-phosphate (DAHP) synthase